MPFCHVHAVPLSCVSSNVPFDHFIAGSDDDDAPPDLDDPSVRLLAASRSSRKWQHSAVIRAAGDSTAVLSRVVGK